jgi:3-hydroxyacyl-CoA dehydrogenase
MSEDSTRAAPTVAIVGAGSIGVAFAIVFARAGLAVRVQDPDPGRRAAAPGEIAARLADLAGFGLVREAVPTILGRIAFAADLAEAVAGAAHVQECAPERLELKRDLFAGHRQFNRVRNEIEKSSCVEAGSSDVSGRLGHKRTNETFKNTVPRGSS